MTINLPGDLEHYILAEVRSGHFASQEDAIIEAIRVFQRQVRRTAPSTPALGAVVTTPDPVLGAMRDAAHEMDEIVAEVMALREKPAGFWSEHGLVIGGIGGGLCLILAMVAAIGFTRRSGPIASTSVNRPPAATSEAAVASVSSLEKSPDAKVPPAPAPAAKGRKEPQPLADYFPTAGHTLQYDVVTNVQGPKGLVRKVRREKWEYKEATAERMVLAYGDLEGNPLLKGGTVKWKEAATGRRRAPDKFNYRNHNGYVEFGIYVPVKQLNTTQPTTQLVWEPVLPLSAAEGDSWSWELRLPNGDKVLKKYTVFKFDQFKGQPSVIIRDSIAGASLLDSELVTYHTFVKGIGEVERTINLESKGAQPQLAGEWKLVEQ